MMGMAKAKKPGPSAGPIQIGLEKWFETIANTGLIDSQETTSRLLKTAPKRFTVFEPMALLPAGSFDTKTTDQPSWASILAKADEHSKTQLWQLTLNEISKKGKDTLTHLAITEGIPLYDQTSGSENLIRSPTGLRVLHGDFGPSTTPSEPIWREEFEKAFWVSTKQNGIYQTWAPRWTMFSRGNVTEKARLLKFPKTSRHRQAWAVDLYGGIGYFVFSYAKLGYRVMCWEINPWSVEGLRRGAAANGWSVRVVQGGDLTLGIDELVAGDEDIVVFLQSNEEAGKRMEELRKTKAAAPVEHVNLGLLPTSRPTWKPSWDIAKYGTDAWIHLHDNVGTKEVEERRQEIQSLYDEWSLAEPGMGKSAKVEHVEYVKTFAPDVWHCVFDVHLTTSSAEGA